MDDKFAHEQHLIAFCHQGLGLHPHDTEALEPASYDVFIAAFGTTGYASLLRIREAPKDQWMQLARTTVYHYHSADWDHGKEFARLVFTGDDIMVRQRYGQFGLVLAEGMRRKVMPW